MSSAEPLLIAKGISKRFGGVAALQDVSFDVRPGEVHTLAGENGSGKSTLIKIITGVHAPDAGTIVFEDQTFESLTPRQAIALGIEVIFQDFSLFPNLSAAENIAISTHVAERRKVVRDVDSRRIAEEVVSRIGIRLDLDAAVEELSVADRQLTAICRALAQEARIIFMDEPTTALTRREVQALFRVVASLKERGVAFVFVSHKLDEVMQISERITVLRNGVVVANGDVKEFDRTALVRAMTGKPLTDTPPSDSVRADAAPILEVEGLTLAGHFADVSFAVRPGEVLGVTGLLGSGRTEIAESLFGITPADSGSVKIEGRPVRIRRVRDAVRAGIGYVPADRLTQGVFLDQSIARNIIAGSIDRLVGKLNLLRRSAASAIVSRGAKELRILMPSPEAPVRSLSGGNQQRVVLAKWLTRNPRILILNSPTVGVDVGSKHEILDMLRDKAGEGVAILVISDDVPELVAVCHRVLVVREGRVVDVLEGDRLDEDEIVKELVA
ncbi:MAG: sugar ABC transporter ATP-binding protein [Actinobacteria bacterium]|nr:MAG: sugar ABC transporter ATP-binding protein [Actinomycetota bacterium]